MRTLGAVIAGGQSRRFGSDKAQALLAGERLIDRALKALAPLCDEIVIVGRAHDTELGAVRSIADWPAPGLGPLGGLASALRLARDEGLDQVLTVPVDCVALPRNLRDLLEPAPAVLMTQPVIGLWPVAVADNLAPILRHDADRSMRAFAARIGARRVAGFDPPNVNTPDDLAALARDRA